MATVDAHKDKPRARQPPFLLNQRLISYLPTWSTVSTILKITVQGRWQPIDEETITFLHLSRQVPFTTRAHKGEAHSACGNVTFLGWMGPTEPTRGMCATVT